MFERIEEKKSNKKIWVALSILGLVGVVALVGIVAHQRGQMDGQMMGLRKPLGPHDNNRYQTMFDAWVKHYKVSYGNFSEYLNRFNVFIKNVEYIQKHNTNNNSYTLAVNQFADLTSAEFKKMYLGTNVNQTATRNEVRLSTSDLPSEIDWSAKGAVTPIKNQGQCGSCWSFSTTGSIEGIHFIKTGKLESFSEQQLVDCSGSYGNQGCNGGLMDDAFKYVIAKGIETESQYPYTAKDGSCHYNSGDAQKVISGYNDVPQQDNMQLKAAVAQQPVSVAIEADQFAFQFYSGGVLTGDCGTKLDHGVLVVGYGSQSGTDYWKVKNSWGASWGMSGFVLIERTDSTSAGKCGIALSASYPTV